MPRAKRVLAIGFAVLVVAGGAAWHWQSEIIGLGTRWYLARIAASEEALGDLSKRRDTVARVHRMLLLAPPPDAQVPELFDMITAVSSRAATGEIDLDWAAYVYGSYERDMARDRPDGRPRRSKEEIEASVAEYVRFYTLQKRPDVPGLRLGNLTGSADAESYTVEEIEKAAREGRDLSHP